MNDIFKIHARTVYDSRGNPTVEVEITTKEGLFRTIVPSGASTGVHEACELRDNDKSKWLGKGVTKAVANVNGLIAPSLISSGINVQNQKQIDDYLIKLDGTENKTKLGANAILGVSLTVAKAAAAKKKVPLYQYLAELSSSPKPFVLPVPFQNVLNGGTHAGGSLAFQEFMIVPYKAKSFSEAVRVNSEVYHILRRLAIEKYGASAGNVGDEGGVAPNLSTPREALDLIVAAIEKAGHKGIVGIALDPASSEFYKDGFYDLNFKNNQSGKYNKLTGEQLGELYDQLIDEYPIISLEDPFAEDDWDSWSKYFKKLNGRIPIIGDDLLVTNTKRIQIAIKKKACDSLLLKVNQIGSLTEAIAASKLAYDSGWGVQVSHRSGETEDTTIADITVGLRTGQIKCGAPSRSERLSKINQLLRIEEELGDRAIYAGESFRKSINI